VPIAEKEQDVGDVADDQIAGLQKRRSERRHRQPVALHQLAHLRNAVLAAHDVDIVGIGFGQREPDEFAPPLDRRPVIELIGHGAASSSPVAFCGQENTADADRVN
jgi:hypothetical protein